MKFAKPRVLIENVYPDMIISQPDLFKKFVLETVFPDSNSKMGKYLDSAISYLKEKQKARIKGVKINICELSTKLYFCSLCLKVNESDYKPISVLVDTGATNSLVHSSIVEKYGIKYEPLQLNLRTASGVDSEAILGICHLKFILHDVERHAFEYCTTFIVSTKLNNLSMILGAEFLFGEDKTLTLSEKNMYFSFKSTTCKIELRSQDVDPISCHNPHNKSQNLTCINCEAGKHMVSSSYTLITDISIGHIHSSEEDSRSSLDFVNENDLSLNLNKSFHITDDIKVLTNSVREIYDNERLPNSVEYFDESHEIKFEALDKTFTIEDGDFSDCPKEWLKKAKSLLRNFSDRFSRFKLDIEVTDKYMADLETIPGKKVIQKCRRLANHKFQFAMQAIKQLEKAGVVRESDSEWRSNVVMVPKPVAANQLRTVTKADLQDGHQHKAELYRLCLDFRDLNKILVFPKQTQFTTLDQFLYKLKNKVTVSLDISSSFFMIPIREEDKMKTAFWVNDHAYEFNVLVMGLKSSPHHLKRFLTIVFSQENYEKYKCELTDEEQRLLPGSFLDIIISYFDDVFVFADDYEQLAAVFKLVLIVCRVAKIRFSIEKSSFFTHKIKILGYSFNTKETILQMDKLKASAILNMKKPASLYELHSRLSSFQYQSIFIPYLKHIAFPLQLLLRKNEFKWGEIEELSWTLLKQVSTLNLRLTIPSPEDNLVLTTDASKIACSANLFCVKNGNLELVATNSKFFGTQDLNKCSYVLESIALAYGFKVYASYILNCTGTIKVFTDAKSLIYAKRNSTHSILLNSTLSYIANFVSLANIEIYHLPGTLNRLADIMSRAISENINCNLPKEHPISKQWAKAIPPLQENFVVTRDILYKFLIEPLSPEPQDIFDRTHRRLQESKSIQQQYNESLRITPEHRYYCGLRMLEQFNDKYLKSNQTLSLNQIELKEAKLLFDDERKEILHKNISEILDEIYKNTGDKNEKKKILITLKEAACGFIKEKNKLLSPVEANKLNNDINAMLKYFNKYDISEVNKRTDKTIKEKILSINNVKVFKEPIVQFQLAPFVKFRPKICNLSNGWDMPFQNEIILKPMECKKIDLGIKIILPKKYCALLVNKSSARLKYKVHVYLGLIDVGYHDFMQVVIQNMSSETVVIPEGHAVSQLLIIKSKIPKYIESWNEIGLESRDGGFGSTGQTFDVINLNNAKFETFNENILSIKKVLDGLQADMIFLDNIPIYLIGSDEKNEHEISTLLDFESNNIHVCNNILEKLPSTELDTLNKSIEENELNKNEKLNFESGYQKLPTLKQKDMDALLVADLCDNNKISLPIFIDLQDLDPDICRIKECLVEEPHKYDTFILKNDVLCKKYSNAEKNSSFLGVYIPTSILYAVIIYIHKFYQHPSKTQTLKQFQNLYYHPRADKAVKLICEACYICSKTRNVTEVKGTVGRERSLNPTIPRETISMDILYFPKSSRGHTHGLLIVDIFSMYVSFYPLKSKNSSEICRALRMYISNFTSPKAIYSDNDQSFRGDCENLFVQYNIKHYTSYGYTQRSNYVEGQVRNFKNMYRGAFLENPIFKHRDWDFLYPLVVTRINSLVSKYGVSREELHFGHSSMSNIPLITDSILFEPLENDIEEISKHFKSRIGHFLNKRKRDKQYYKISKDKSFGLGEIVMYKNYTPNQIFDDNFDGPARIIDLQPKGATLKKIKGNEIFSVSYDNLRKVNFDEFLLLLPKDFDSSILENFKNTRYRRIQEDVMSEDKKGYTENSSDGLIFDKKLTRSGKLYNIKLNNISMTNISNIGQARKLPIANKYDYSNAKKSCMKYSNNRKIYGEPIIYEYPMDDQVISMIVSHSRKKVFCKLPDGFNCRLKIQILPDVEPIMHRKVKFSHLEIYYV